MAKPDIGSLLTHDPDVRTVVTFAKLVHTKHPEIREPEYSSIEPRTVCAGEYGADDPELPALLVKSLPGVLKSSGIPNQVLWVGHDGKLYACHFKSSFASIKAFLRDNVIKDGGLSVKAVLLSMAKQSEVEEGSHKAVICVWYKPVDGDWRYGALDLDVDFSRPKDVIYTLGPLRWGEEYWVRRLKEWAGQFGLPCD